MFKRSLLVVLISTSVLFQGCAGQGPKEEAGMIIGGVLGGLIASETAGRHHRAAIVMAGTLMGAAIGSAIGKNMDDTDRLKTAQTLETVRTGVSSTWRNPDTGYHYSVTPTKTYVSSGAPCREYTIDAIIGGKKEKVYGTACRMPDGSWKIQN